LDLKDSKQKRLAGFAARMGQNLTDGAHGSHVLEHTVEPLRMSA
jgi:hypothetical protein